MDRLPLSDAECAAQLGMTEEELLAARATVAQELLILGEVYGEAQAEAERLIDAARQPLQEAAARAYRLGMGFDLISQCTAEQRLHPDGRRKRTKSVRGRVTHTTISRWIAAVLERAKDEVPATAS